MANGLHQIPSDQYPGPATQKPAEYSDGDLLVKMIREDLIAKRITIQGCRDLIHYLRDYDAPTCRRLVGVLAINGQRATDSMRGIVRISVDAGMEHPKVKSR
jgi:bacterioferritin